MSNTVMTRRMGERASGQTDASVEGRGLEEKEMPCLRGAQLRYNSSEETGCAEE